MICLFVKMIETIKKYLIYFEDVSKGSSITQPQNSNLVMCESD